MLWLSTSQPWLWGRFDGVLAHHGVVSGVTMWWTSSTTLLMMSITISGVPTVEGRADSTTNATPRT